MDSDSEVTSYQSGAGKFPAGKVTWRVRAKDSYSGWGEWRSASFTVTYAAVSVSLTTPTSGSKDGGQKITFAWTITPGSGTVTGTEMEYSTDDGVTWNKIFSVSESKTSYVSNAGQFQNGKLNWRVRAKDSYSGWGDWRSASFTVVYNKPTVNLTTPTSGTKEGSEQITFAWSITPGSGSVTDTQMEYSTDDGISWTPLLDVSGSRTSYVAPAVKFPAGKISWRVRAKDSYSYSGWSDWRSASFTVAYAGQSQAVAVNSPTSGRIAAASAQKFQVHLDATSPVYTPFTVAAASFFWRSGTTGEYTERSMTPDGSNAAVTIAGGTFPSGIIQWYASVTDQTDRTTETAVYTIQALNAAVEAFPISPQNTIESTSGEITFLWSYASLDGSRQSAALLEYSRDGETWLTIANTSGDGTSYTTQPGFFAAPGTVYWRVQAFNASGTAGPTSAAVSFTLFGAPYVDGVTGDGKPFATITWQVEGQVSYEIQVDGRHWGPYFGENVRSFTLQEPLEDGLHTIRVRAQNKNSMWSEWAEAEMSVLNDPGGRNVQLYAQGGQTIGLYINGTFANMITRQPQDVQTTDPQLAKISCTFTKPFFGSYSYIVYEKQINNDYWEDVGFGVGEFDSDEVTGDYTISNPEQHDGSLFRFVTGEFDTTSRAAKFTYAEPFKQSPEIRGSFPPETGFYLIYRDDTLIGKTFSRVFDDNTVLGSHSYYVIQALPGGYYAKSGVVTASASVDSPSIARLEGGEFIELALSTDGDRAQDFTKHRDVVYTQYAGARYPDAETGESETLSGTFDVAYPKTAAEAAAAFEELVGEAVILKTPGGKILIGVLEGYDLNNPEAYCSYRCTLQQMNWKEFRDETNSISV